VFSCSFVFQVTILIAASGVHNLPAVNDYSDLVSALDSLTSINYKCIEVKVMVGIFFSFLLFINLYHDS
jgi:uncharacterized membrane protein